MHRHLLVLLLVLLLLCKAILPEPVAIQHATAMNISARCVWHMYRRWGKRVSSWASSGAPTTTAHASIHGCKL